MTAPRLSHVILRVADLDRAVAFWRDRVGLPLVGSGGPLAFLDAGGATIALAAAAPAADAGGGLAALTELVLEVPDVRAAHAELAARGVPFRTPPRVLTGEAPRELWGCDFRDPDGHLASLTGWIAR